MRATGTDPGWWLLCVCMMDLLRICTTTPDVGGLLSRSRTSAQGAWVFTYPDCCCFPQVVVYSVVEDVLNFNGTPTAKGGLAYYAGHARLHDLAHIPWYWIRQHRWKKARKEAKQKCVVKIKSLAKELKVVNESNTTYPVGGRQCTDYIKVKINFSKFTCKKLFPVLFHFYR
jgi:hypothetical protein